MEQEKETESYTSFAAFWPYYLKEHSKPITRAWHYFGTALAVLVLIASLVMGYYWMLLAVPVAGYLFAWIGHFGFEKNRPATFKYPLWSLLGDLKMAFLFFTGRMGGELKKHGLS